MNIIQYAIFIMLNMIITRALFIEKLKEYPPIYFKKWGELAIPHSYRDVQIKLNVEVFFEEFDKFKLQFRDIQGLCTDILDKNDYCMKFNNKTPKIFNKITNLGHILQESMEVGNEETNKLKQNQSLQTISNREYKQKIGVIVQQEVVINELERSITNMIQVLIKLDIFIQCEFCPTRALAFSAYNLKQNIQHMQDVFGIMIERKITDSTKIIGMANVYDQLIEINNTMSNGEKFFASTATDILRTGRVQISYRNYEIIIVVHIPIRHSDHHIQYFETIPIPFINKKGDMLQLEPKYEYVVFNNASNTTYGMTNLEFKKCKNLNTVDLCMDITFQLDEQNCEISIFNNKSAKNCQFKQVNKLYHVSDLDHENYLLITQHKIGFIEACKYEEKAYSMEVAYLVEESSQITIPRACKISIDIRHEYYNYKNSPITIIKPVALPFAMTTNVTMNTYQDIPGSVLLHMEKEMNETIQIFPALFIEGPDNDCPIIAFLKNNKDVLTIIIKIQAILILTIIVYILSLLACQNVFACIRQILE